MELRRAAEKYAFRSLPDYAGKARLVLLGERAPYSLIKGGSDEGRACQGCSKPVP
jgi:hypothetical protein